MNVLSIEETLLLPVLLAQDQWQLLFVGLELATNVELSMCRLGFIRKATVSYLKKYSINLTSLIRTIIQQVPQVLESLKQMCIQDLTLLNEIVGGSTEPG